MDNNREKIQPTTEWAKQKYEEFNRLYFNNELPPCIIIAHPINSNTCGQFFYAHTVSYVKSTREMFVQTPQGRIWLNKSNIYNVAQPTIEINNIFLNYEEYLENTLIHEMCHYYTEMNGVIPKRAHGKEFMTIGKLVCERSNGKYVIQRLASAEEIQSEELSQEMSQKMAEKCGKILIFGLKTPEKVKTTDYNYGYAKIVTKSSLDKWLNFLSHRSSFYDVELYDCNSSMAWFKTKNLRVPTYYISITKEEIINKFQATLSDQSQVTSVIQKRQNELEQRKIKETLGLDLAKLVFHGKNYKELNNGNLIQNSGIITFGDQQIKVEVSANAFYGTIAWSFPDYNAEFKEGEYIYDDIYNDKLTRILCQTLGRDMIKALNLQIPTQMPQKTEEPRQIAPQQQQEKLPTFRLKLMNGKTFEVNYTSKDELRAKLKERFPKMNDENIEKIMNNPANFVNNENRTFSQLIEKVINKFLQEEMNIPNNEDDDIVTIQARTPLSEYIPEA